MGLGIYRALASVWAVMLFMSVMTPAAQAKVEGTTIYLGAAVSLTGKYSTNGELTRRGYDMAVEKINQRGGVLVDGVTYQLAVIYYDDESTPARGTQLAERLILQDGVRFMLGPYSSGLTKAMAPITERHQVPMVEANGASLSLFQNDYRYLFAVLSTTEQYLTSAVDLMHQQGKPASEIKVAMAFENDPFSQDVRTGVIEAITKLGMQIVVDDKLPPELDDMSSTLTKVKVAQPDLLLISGHSRGAALVVRQLDEMQIDVPMIALTHCDAAQIIRKFGARAENILCAAQWASSLTYRDELFGSASDFALAYEALYGEPPAYQVAESAAAVMIYGDAFTRANSFDPSLVRDALSATVLDTFYGPVKFDAAGKNIAKPMVLMQVQDGAYRVVYPPAAAEAPLRYEAKTGEDIELSYFGIGADLVINGMMIGAVFALAALGMALVWGVLNIINIAQGEFVMLGGFVALTGASLGVPLVLTVPLAALVMFFVGWAVYRLVIFRIIERDLFVSLLATFGLSILFQQLANQVFGSDVRTLETGLSTLNFAGGALSISGVKLVAFVLAVLIGLALWAFLGRSRLGQAIRATAQNARAARILGIDTDKVYAATFGLNAALCGAAGSLVVMAWAIHPYIGLPYTVRSFLIVVVAGVGNVAGVVLAGLGLGAAENVAGFLFGAEMQIAFVFVLMVVVLVWRNWRLQRRREYLK